MLTPERQMTVTPVALHAVDTFDGELILRGEYAGVRLLVLPNADWSAESPAPFRLFLIQACEKVAH